MYRYYQIQCAHLAVMFEFEHYSMGGVAQCTYLRGQAVHIYVYDDPDNNIHKIRIYMYHIEVITLIKPD